MSGWLSEPGIRPVMGPEPEATGSESLPGSRLTGGEDRRRTPPALADGDPLQGCGRDRLEAVGLHLDGVAGLSTTGLDRAVHCQRVQRRCLELLRGLVVADDGDHPRELPELCELSGLQVERARRVGLDQRFAVGGVETDQTDVPGRYLDRTG